MRTKYIDNPQTLNLVERLGPPVMVMNARDYGIDMNKFQHQLREAYTDYESDIYLQQQLKIEMIKDTIPRSELFSTPDAIWSDIYTGSVQDSAFPELFPSLTRQELSRLKGVKSPRSRLISAYELEWRGEWLVTRIPAQTFSQIDADLIASSGTADYRRNSRKFKELPDELFDSTLRILLGAVADMVKKAAPSVACMNIVVHHTLVQCYPGQVCTNSPEGIHQDGMDFIVSALVVQRENITGGKSIVYRGEKHSTLMPAVFEKELLDGEGIFQADRGTDLWHEVTAIKAMDGNKPAYRSSLGFDVSVTRYAA